MRGSVAVRSYVVMRLWDKSRSQSWRVQLRQGSYWSIIHVVLKEFTLQDSYITASDCGRYCCYPRLGKKEY